MRGYGGLLWSKHACGQWVVHQKFRHPVDGHAINWTLHWAKKMVVKVWDMDGLVNHDVIYLAGQRVIISKCTTNNGIGFSAEEGVISFKKKSIIIEQNKGITA